MGQINGVLRSDNGENDQGTEITYGLLTTPTVEVMNLAFANGDVVWRSWKYDAKEDVRSVPHTNEVIGAYVTARTRIHHYHYLDRLRENAMYCDMDSMVYIQPNRDGPLLIETGDKLGAWSLSYDP